MSEPLIYLIYLIALIRLIVICEIPKSAKISGSDYLTEICRSKSV